MRKRQIIVITVTFILAIMITAGDMDATQTPANTQSYNLNDVYNRLDSGAAGSQSSFNEPSSAPGSTMRTINEIMSIAPAVNGNAADASDVVDGKFFWSLMSGSWGLTEGTHICPIYPDPIPVSGQTAMYSTGDDGDLEKGLPYPPDPRFTRNLTDGIITDNLTGLVWLYKANYNDIDGGTGPTSWSEALNFCSQLSDGYCGLRDDSIPGDWRLPNIKELQSLLYYGTWGPLDSYLYADLSVVASVADQYWTSTSEKGIGMSAFVIDFTTGAIWFSDKANSFYVWPVRDSD